MAMLRKQVEEMGQLNQGLLKEKEEFLRREQEGQKEKRGIFESHSKEVIALRQEIKGLKIIKQRKEVLEADLIEAMPKNEERTQELEEEKVRRRKAEKVLKEFQSQMMGKSVDKLEAQKRERVKKAEKRKEVFKKKQTEKTRSEDSNNVRKEE